MIYNSTAIFKEIYERNVDTVYRVCYMYLKNATDAEDAVHNTFLKLFESEKAFESEEHEKAWLIRVCSNVCKNMLSHWSRKAEDISALEIKSEDKADETLISLCSLPEKLKLPVYLYYYDGYTSAEIGKMLGIPDSTVRNRLQKARQLLKEILDDDTERKDIND